MKIQLNLYLLAVSACLVCIQHPLQIFDILFGGWLGEILNGQNHLCYISIVNAVKSCLGESITACFGENL